MKEFHAEELFPLPGYHRRGPWRGLGVVMYFHVEVFFRSPELRSV